MTLMAASWPVLTWRPWRTEMERRSKTWVTDLDLGHIYSTFPSLNLLRTEKTQFASSNSLFWSDFWWESRWAGLSPLQSRFLGTYLFFALSICPEFVDKQKCTIYSQRLFCKYGLSKGKSKRFLWIQVPNTVRKYSNSPYSQYIQLEKNTFTMKLQRKNDDDNTESISFRL